MRTGIAPDLDMPSVLRALSSPFDPEASAEAAGLVLAAPDPGAVVARMLSPLLRHKTPVVAMDNLERAGADLERLAVSSDVVAATYPLNRLLPPGPEAGVPVAEIRRKLQTLQRLHQEAVWRLLDEVGEGAFVLITGQAWSAAHPDHPRWCADADLYAPTLDAGLAMLEALHDRMGFAMHGCKVARLHRDGFALLKTFRVSDGYEINVGVMAGGQASPFTAVPLHTPEPLERRARTVTTGGREARACSAEDLLLMTALRPLREGFSTLRGLDDARYLLTHGEGSLDWGYVAQVARANWLTASLNALIGWAERAEGRPLVPEAIRGRLEGRRSERRLVAVVAERAPGLSQASDKRRTGPARRRAQRAGWAFGFLRSNVGTARAAIHFVADRLQMRMFKRQGRRMRAVSGWPSRSFARARILRPRYRSVCELRAAPAPEALGRCLSRTDGRGGPGWLGDAARSRLAAIVAAMPDRGEEGGFRKRGLDGAGGRKRQAHRCEAFVVNLSRIG